VCGDELSGKRINLVNLFGGPSFPSATPRGDYADRCLASTLLLVGIRVRWERKRLRSGIGKWEVRSGKGER
jgi:hypothetical protein